MRSVLLQPGPTAAVSPSPSGQGRRTAARSGGGLQAAGEPLYLWGLVALELLATAVLRHWSRHHHGG